MAKPKLDSSKLTLPQKKDVKKIDTQAVQSVDSAIKKIHEVKPNGVGATVEEETKRMTLDIPVSIHKEVRRKIFDTEQTIKDYFISLAKKDLGIQ